MNVGIRGRSEVAPAPAGPPPAPPPAADGEENPPPLSDRPMSPGLPPSYTEALQHRTVEYGGYDMFYTGPPPPLPSNFNLGPDPNRIDSVRLPEEGRESRTSVDEDTERCMKMTLPPMHMCMAVTCLIFNFLIPGSGTMLAAFGVFCCTKRNEWTVKRKFGACCLNFTIGLAQLILTPLLLLGWVWSILWGFAFVGVSSEAYHGRKRTNQQTGQNPHRPLTAATPRSMLSHSVYTPRPGTSGQPSTQPTNTTQPAQEQSQIQVISPVIHASAEPSMPAEESTSRQNTNESTPAARQPEPEPAVQTQSPVQEPEIRIASASASSNESEQLPNSVTET